MISYGLGCQRKLVHISIFIGRSMIDLELDMKDQVTNLGKRVRNVGSRNKNIETGFS